VIAVGPIGRNQLVHVCNIQQEATNDEKNIAKIITFLRTKTVVFRRPKTRCRIGTVKSNRDWQIARQHFYFCVYFDVIGG
jgi:hypothetical protein